MITFTSQSVYYQVTSNGIGLGALYVTRERAQRAATSLTREWKGTRSFGVTKLKIETWTAHEM